MARPPFKAVIFDLDGVVTKTAQVHAASWKEMFDEFLRERSARDNLPFKEFTHQNDYLPFVDGKPRYDGVRSFLESRGIRLPEGTKDDGPDQETVCGLGNRKNVKFLEVLKKNGVEQYPSTVVLIRALKERGVRIGVASSSKNCQYVLQAAGIEDLFESRVDGMVSLDRSLQGKPAPDIFVSAAADVGAEPADAVVVEDAVAGVQAGRNGRFGLVVGLARKKNEDELMANGADVVIPDFEGITVDTLTEWFNNKNNT